MTGDLLFHSVAAALLRKADCLVGANRSASAALGALIRIDVIDVALGDCSYGALVDTCSTCHTVVTNYVSHNSCSLKLLIMFLHCCKDTNFFGNTYK